MTTRKQSLKLYCKQRATKNETKTSVSASKLEEIFYILTLNSLKANKIKIRFIRRKIYNFAHLELNWS